MGFAYGRGEQNKEGWLSPKARTWPFLPLHQLPRIFLWYAGKKTIIMTNRSCIYRQPIGGFHI